MRNKLMWILLAFASLTFNTTLAAPELTSLPRQSQAAHLSAEVLARYHYKRIPLDDAASSKIFDNYLKELDSEKVFFFQADIDHFAYARTMLDDAILNEDLSIPFAIYNLYQQRITERITYARSLLIKGFDFANQESYQYTRKNEPW
ncbi:MAG TPA: tail-specific protease, partial [Gallionella sp.]